jgi:Phage phiEco32-like COOH.NH2 ligase-type 2
MKEVPISDMLTKTGEAVIVVNRAVAAFTSDWSHYAAFEIKSDEITIIRARRYDTKAIELTYFEDKTNLETVCVVPPEFMLRLPGNADAQRIIKKYNDYALLNITGQCGFQGSGIGSDPEIFVEDEKGQIIPAFHFLGSKGNPNKAREIVHGNNNIYWDGFQAEFDTCANSCMGYHTDSLHYGLEGLLKAAKKFNPNAKLSSKTVFDIPPELIQKSLPEHVAFGCNPSLNVYGIEGDKSPGDKTYFRPAGGHIHFGFPAAYKAPEIITKMVKALDALVGVAGVSAFAKFDDPRRRMLYGLAGEYRLPPHGLEYRTLSNAWLFHPMIANIFFDLARSTTEFGKKGFMKVWKGDEAEIIRIINECDVEASRAMLAENERVLKQVINQRYNEPNRTSFVYDVIMHGIEAAIRDPRDIEGNWKLNGGWKIHLGVTGTGVFSAAAQGDKV